MRENTAAFGLICPDIRIPGRIMADKKFGGAGIPCHSSSLNCCGVMPQGRLIREFLQIGGLMVDHRGAPEPESLLRSLSAGLAVNLDPVFVVCRLFVYARIVVVTVAAFVSLFSLERSEPLSLGAGVEIGRVQVSGKYFWNFGEIYKSGTTAYDTVKDAINNGNNFNGFAVSLAFFF